MERMEIRSRPRVDSPSQRPLALETLMSSIATVMQSSFSSQLGALQSNFSRQLSAMSHQQGSLTAEISGVLERLDRVEESKAVVREARAQTTGSRIQELPPARSSRLYPTGK